MQDNKSVDTFGKFQDIDIKEVPDINSYAEIIKAAKTGRLVIFIGAGVSKQIGLPLWKEFALNRLEKIYEQGLVDYRTYCDLKNIEPKKLLTICEMFIKENNIVPQPAKEIFMIKDFHKYKEVYGKLYSINAIYVTTNYDECLDKFALNTVQDIEVRVDNNSESDEHTSVASSLLKTPIGEVVIEQSDLLESKLQNGNVIHIHGSVNNESGMIVTLNDYMMHYGNLSKDYHPELSIFLDSIFNTKYVVLFVGYGLEEYEILEYMLSKIKNPKNTRTHYMLYSCFKEDKKLVELVKNYYLGFGVELIPYDISRCGYKQLVTVIDQWQKVLKTFSNGQDYIQKMEFVDSVIADYSTKFPTKIKAVIELANKDESLEKYLFKKISDVRWLDILIDNGFFNPEKVPLPINKGDGYSIPYWEQTDYLNKLLDDEENLKSKVVIEKVLKIIRTISSYKDSEGNSIDNYHIWNQFTDVVNKIPNEYITNEFLDLLRVWTKSKFKINFVVGKIGETLLNKFLNTNNVEDHRKAEIIINNITALDPDKHSLIIDTYHFNKLFNDKTIETIARKCSMDFIINYLNKITNVLHKDISKNVIKHDNNVYLIKLEDDGERYVISILHDDDPITNVFLNKVDDEYKVLNKKEIPYCDDDVFTKSILGWMYEIFDASKLQDNIHVIVRNLYYGLFLEGAYHSLFMHRQGYHSDTVELFLHFYKNLLTKKFETESIDEIKINFLNILLNNNYFALVKVALYIIANVPNKYLQIIWQNIDSERMKLIFQESYFGDELRNVLENISEIDDGYAVKILKLIECGPYYKYSSVDTEKHKRIWKIKRLNALSHIPFFKEYTIKNFKEVNPNIKLIPAVGEVMTTWGGEKAPLEIEDLTKMTNEELSRFISVFKTVNRWDGPTVEGLGKVLRKSVKNNPEKYYSNLDPFIDSGYYYIYEIFNGLSDAWSDKKQIEWESVLEFIKRYIDRGKFWDDSLVISDDTWKADHKWVIGVFVDLISEGTQNDKWAMEFQDVLKSKDIILQILFKVLKYTEENDNLDYIQYVWNSTRGRALKALLNISLFLKRNSADDNNKWDKELRDIYITYMDSDILDAFIIFGLFLPQFMYLDKQWAINKVNSIHYEYINWEGFMVGYIFSGTIYKDIYELMINHYLYSIYYGFKNEETIEGVVNHVVLGYLNSFDDKLSNELFDRLIEKWDYKIISKILNNFGTYDDKLQDLDENIKIIRQKIISFWNKLYIRYSSIKAEELSDDDKKIISDSIRLIGILDIIDNESVKLIRFVIPYIEINFNAYYLIEKLSKISSSEDLVEKRQNIGEIFQDLVKYIVPTYPEEEIVKIVKYLYEVKDAKVKAYADNICNIYARHGIEFLRDLCLENRDF